MEHLLESIHKEVDELVEIYVKNYFESKVDFLAKELDVNRSDVLKAIKMDRGIYEPLACKAKTVLGNPCKYKTIPNTLLCVKHTSQQNKI